MNQKFTRAGLAAALLLLAACASKGPVEPAVPVNPVALPSSFPISADQPAVGMKISYTTQPKDTLLDVARQYDLGYTQLMTANKGVDPWNPTAGRNVTLPAFYLLPDVPRRGIVVNLPQHRLFYFHPDGKTVETFPIGVGVEGRITPLGTTRIVKKTVHPVWHVPASIRAEDPTLPAAVGPGPDNPLGDYAFTLGWPSYLIHATNKPYGIGRNVSHGCIQLYPEDMERLFNEAPVGTPVTVLNQEIESAWVGNDLYVAAFPSKKQAEAIGLNQTVAPEIPRNLKKQVKAVSPGHSRPIDWSAVEAVARERTGIPTPVTLPAQ